LVPRQGLRMKKPKDVGRAPRETGNASSGKNREPARPWTPDEMRAAKPLPLPTVDPAASVHSPGVPHAGKGQVRPAGRPEKDKEPEQ
jgi:hypothetical protein